MVVKVAILRADVNPGIANKIKRFAYGFILAHPVGILQMQNKYIRRYPGVLCWFIAYTRRSAP